MMLNLWNWLVSHAGIIAGFVGGVLVVGVPAFVTLRGQRQNKRLADEKNKLELKAYRQQFCMPLLISIHEVAPIVAEMRNAHDHLWVRQKLFFGARSYVKRINRVFENAHERAAVAGSELSVDPAGKKVMDAFVAYLKAQNEYVQAIIKPLSRFPTWYFNKADIPTLDKLSEKANDKLTALEEAIRLFLDSPH